MALKTEPGIQNEPAIVKTNDKPLCGDGEMTFYTLKTRVLNLDGECSFVSHTLLGNLVKFFDGEPRPQTLTLRAIERLSFAHYRQSLEDDFLYTGLEAAQPWKFVIFVGGDCQPCVILPNDRSFRATIAEALSQTDGKTVIEAEISHDKSAYALKLKSLNKDISNQGSSTAEKSEKGA